MRSYRVCVTDDCAESATVLCEGLKLHHYEAFAAHTGAEGLAACERGDVDLILLDVCLPDIDGYEVCRRLKESPQTRDIIVIFVTVKGTKDDISKGYQFGATDYITKPYNLPMVMVRVDAALRSRALTHVASGDADPLADLAYTDPLTGLRNRRYLLERLQEEAERAHRYNYPVSCALFDVDEVWPLDAELGPVSMDDLLIEVAMAIRNYSRTYDVLARYDSTIFGVILPHTPMEDAVNYASKILEDVAATTFSDPSLPTGARLSAGIVACQNGSAQGSDFVLGEAMRNLLQAKSFPGERLVARNLEGIE